MTDHTILKRLQVNRSADLAAAPGQTKNAVRISGVSAQNSQVEGLWFGKVHTGPGEVSDPHHHGEAETGGYVLQGRAFIRSGDGYRDIVYLEAGDFIYVPPFLPHIEGNASKTEELVWLTTRTPENIVVNLSLDDVSDVDIDYLT
jgi:uncharacterized RmlC-like cupin family protein